MSFFDTEKGVNEYIKMAEGYDGSDLIAELRNFLKDGSSVLEIGMGPGKDLDMLKKFYKVTGTDTSKVFINRYKKMNPDTDVFFLDAKKLDIKRKFDCIYSNKVLQHLTKNECFKSLKIQKNLLNPKGILLHSFWYGDKIEDYDGLLFVRYKINELKKIVKNDYDILKTQRYKEFKKNDSFYMILQRKKG
jgi:cyclopropane fatty-acyl-phospholipid synthase-like methyltransferase